MAEEFLGSESPTASLTVGNPPFGQIIQYNVPPAVRVGEPVEMAVLVKNTGDLYGSFFVDLWDADTGARLWQSTKLGLGAGEQVWFYAHGDVSSPPPTMPDHGLELMVQTHHNGEIDDAQQKHVPLLLPIATALSINIAPPMVAPGADYVQSGRLTRTDSGVGLVGMTIIIKRNGVMLPTIQTDGSGNYSVSIPAPTAMATYTCQSEFLGSIRLGYAGAVNTATLIVPTEPLWVPLVSAIIGGGGVYLATKNPAVALVGVVAGGLIGYGLSPKQPEVPSYAGLTPQAREWLIKNKVN